MVFMNHVLAQSRRISQSFKAHLQRCQLIAALTLSAQAFKTHHNSASCREDFTQLLQMFVQSNFVAQTLSSTVFIAVCLIAKGTSAAFNWYRVPPLNCRTVKEHRVSRQLYVKQRRLN